MAADALAELRGLHQPPMDLSAALGEGFAALAVGLLLAWLTAQAVRFVTTRQVPPEAVALKRLAAVSEDDGLAARGAILQEFARSVPGEGDWMARLDARFGGLFSDGAGAGLREALYKPGAAFDVAAFDVAVRKALSQAAR